MNGEVTPFHRLIDHLYVFFGETSFLFLCPGFGFLFLLLSCKSSIYFESFLDRGEPGFMTRESACCCPCTGTRPDFGGSQGAGGRSFTRAWYRSLVADLAEEAALEGLLSRVTWMWCQGADGSLSFSVYPEWCPARGLMWPHACWLLGGGVFSWSLESREGSFLGLEE